METDQLKFFAGGQSQREGNECRGGKGRRGGHECGHQHGHGHGHKAGSHETCCGGRHRAGGKCQQ